MHFYLILDKGISAIEVPRANVFLTEVSTEMLDIANRLHLTLLTRNGSSTPNTALLNFQNSNETHTIPSLNSSLPVLAPFDLELMNHLNNSDTSNLANLSERNSTQNSLLSMFSHSNFPLNLINMSDLNDPNSNMSLFRNSIRQPTFERSGGVDLGLMPGIGSLNHSESLDSLGYTNFVQSSLPQTTNISNSADVSIPQVAASNTHTSNSNSYSFRVIHNKFIGPANEIFNLLDIPSPQWGTWIKRLPESERVVVDMRSMQILKELKYKKGYTQSWFVTATALVELAAENPTRLNPACSRVNLKEGFLNLCNGI